MISTSDSSTEFQGKVEGVIVGKGIAVKVKVNAGEGDGSWFAIVGLIASGIGVCSSACSVFEEDVAVVGVPVAI